MRISANSTKEVTSCSAERSLSLRHQSERSSRSVVVVFVKQKLTLRFLPASSCAICWPRPNHNEIPFSLWIANNCPLFPCHLACKPHPSRVLPGLVVWKHLYLAKAPRRASFCYLLSLLFQLYHLSLRLSSNYISQGAPVGSSRGLAQCHAQCVRRL